jgi:SAM-dependent methyltransferase
MKNKDKWFPVRFNKKNGKIQGNHIQKIIASYYLPAIEQFASGLLADIGCADVPFYQYYKDLVTDNICIDWEHSGSNLSYLDYNADINKGLHFLKSNTFDTVLCTDVLEHINKPELLFSEMSRILKNGGYLILGVPYLYWIHDPKYDFYRYTNHILKLYCQENNLDIIKLEAYGGLPEVIYDLIHKGYGHCNIRGRRIFYPIWETIGKIVSKLPLTKKISIKSRDVFPLGYLLVAKKKS